MCLASVPSSSTSPCCSEATCPPAPSGYRYFADSPMDPMSRNPWTPFSWPSMPGDEPHCSITGRVGPHFLQSIFQHPRTSRHTHLHRWVNFHLPTPSNTASCSRIPQTPMIPCPNCNNKFRNRSGFKCHFSTIHQHHPGLDVPVTELRWVYHPTLTGMSIFLRILCHPLNPHTLK